MWAFARESRSWGLEVRKIAIHRGVRAVMCVATVGAVVAAGAPAVVTTAEAGTTTYSLNTVRTPDGQTLRVRWNPCQSRILYRVNATLSSTTSGGRRAAVADVRTAFARLGAATGMTFVYGGGTTKIPTGSSWSSRQTNAEIVVAWVNQRRISTRSTLLGRDAHGRYVAGSGGYAFKSWSTGGPWSGAIGRGFVVLNAANNAVFRAGFGNGVRRGNLVEHELGHAVGLNHVVTSSQIMYPVISRRTSSGYRTGDRAGLARVGRPAGCIPTPSWVWRDL